MRTHNHSYSHFHNDCLFFLDKKKLKLKFRTQNAPVRSLFSAFGINSVFCNVKKQTIIMKMRVHYTNKLLKGTYTTVYVL